MPRRVALLSLHSHRDRSFIDDQRLSIWSGILRDEGLGSDVVVAVLDPSLGLSDPGLADLVAMLAEYDVVVIDRVWDAQLVAHLRERSGAVFVFCKTEHRVDSPSADWVCLDEQDAALPVLVRHIRGEVPHPPQGSRRVSNGLGVPSLQTTPVSPRPPRFAPDLTRRLATPGRRPGLRTYSIIGNPGCPYQADARDNPLYAGVTLPPDRGRGCAFCTTGNTYEYRPPEKTAASVLEQIRFVRREAPEISLLVLKDQNPFGYLTEVLAALAREPVGRFDLLLESRADWFLRSSTRFEQALQQATAAGVRVAPFLVGIENFSDAELARLNKGCDAATNERFIATLRDWQRRHPDALTLDHCSFGFILFTPWTTLTDLRVNLAALRRSRFNELRGSVLVSRARLYPDTALFHLAARDGLLDETRGLHTDSDVRYGYHEATPWRFADPAVAHLATLATECSERLGHRDQLGLFSALLDAFDAAGDAWASLTADEVLARHRDAAGTGTEDPVLADRLRRLAQPLDLDSFDGGWRLASCRRLAERLRVRVEHPTEPALEIELGPPSDKGYARSRHYAIRHLAPTLTARQRTALDAFCRAIVASDV